MHTFAAERDSITYQSQQKWLCHFQEQGCFFNVLFSSHLEALAFSCFPPKCKYLAVGHGEQEHDFHTHNPSKYSHVTDLGGKKSLHLVDKFC